MKRSLLFFVVFGALCVVLGGCQQSSGDGTDPIKAKADTRHSNIQDKQDKMADPGN